MEVITRTDVPASASGVAANVGTQSSPIQLPGATWLTTWRFTMILAALIFVAFPQVVMGFHSFVFRDYGLFGYPLAHYHKECFWRGEIPLWNPYNNFGLPFLAQWGTMVVYPPSLIYLLLPLPWSLALFTLLHQLFGGVGMFVLARKWTGNPLAAGLGGIAFAFHGFVLNCLMWPHYSASMAWMPWVIYAVTGAWRGGARSLCIAVLAGAMQMLSGTPEVILFTWVLLAGLWCTELWNGWRAASLGAGRFSLIVLLVTVVAAVQLLPFLELLQHSNRDSKFDTGMWPIPASGWTHLLVPLYRMRGTEAGVFFQPQQNLTSSYYAGVGVVVAGLLALFWVRNRRVWFLFAAAVCALVFGMGEHTPLYGWLRDAVPGIGFMRYSSKTVIVMAFTWPLLAAFGIAAFLAQTDVMARKRRNYLAAGILGCAVILMAGIVAHAWRLPQRDFPAQPVSVNAAIRVAFLLSIAAGLWWLIRGAATRRRVLVEVFVLLMMFFELFTHVPPQNPSIDREAMTVEIPWLKHMKPRPTLGESRALLSLTAQQQYLFGSTSNLTETFIAQRNGLFADINLVEGMPKADGFYALYIKEEREVHFRLYRTDDEARPGLGRFLGLCQVTAPTNVVVWHARTNYLPWVTAGQVPIFADPKTTLEALMATNFVAEHVVYLPLQASNEVRVPSGGAAQIKSCDVTSHRISAEVSASAPSLVVIAQTHYPRWKAFVDGQPTRLWHANHAFQALEVPAGNHRLTVVYQDRPFQIGAVISLLSLSGVGLAWLRFSRSGTKVALNQDTEPSPGTSQAAMANYLPHTTA